MIWRIYQSNGYIVGLLLIIVLSITCVPVLTIVANKQDTNDQFEFNQTLTLWAEDGLEYHFESSKGEFLTYSVCIQLSKQELQNRFRPGNFEKVVRRNAVFNAKGELIGQRVVMEGGTRAAILWTHGNTLFIVTGPTVSSVLALESQIRKDEPVHRGTFYK